MDRPVGIIDFTPSPKHFPFESRWFDSSVGPVHYVDEGGVREGTSPAIDDRSAAKCTVLQAEDEQHSVAAECLLHPHLDLGEPRSGGPDLAGELGDAPTQRGRRHHVDVVGELLIAQVGAQGSLHERRHEEVPFGDEPLQRP